MAINFPYRYIIPLHRQNRPAYNPRNAFCFAFRAIDINGEIFLSGNVIPIGIAGEIGNHSGSWRGRENFCGENIIITLHDSEGCMFPR